MEGGRSVRKELDFDDAVVRMCVDAIQAVKPDASEEDILGELRRIYELKDDGAAA